MADTKSIDGVEKDLIDASSVIGEIRERNGIYSYGLARIIWEFGKPVEDLTVKELITLHRQYNGTYNRIYREIAEVKA